MPQEMDTISALQADADRLAQMYPTTKPPNLKSVT